MVVKLVKNFKMLTIIIINLFIQTNFNTVLTREKMKKEQIISDLTEKLHKVTQQQEKDKGECVLSTLNTVFLTVLEMRHHGSTS